MTTVDEPLGRRADSRCHAFGDDALGDLDAVGLVEALRSGAVSAPELVEAAIARTEAVNPTLNGLAYEAFDRARKRANAPRGYGGFFDGVPTYIKDNVAVAGMPTMQGTDAWEPWPIRADGAFARVFLATGLVPLGKTQMSEFGFSGSAEHPRIGPVRNPWNPDYTAGASSSGAAAFVAAGVVPIAHANDGGGSIRIPAAVNGLVGLKPTRGRLPLDEQAARMPLHLVANGVLSRSVRDTAAFLREAERVYRNPKLPPIGDVTRAGKQRLNIAVCTKSVLREASPEVRELTLKSAALLEELGHKVTEIDNPVPAQFKDDFLLYWQFLAFAIVRGGRRMIAPSFDRTKLDNLTLGLERNAARNLYRLPVAIARLSASRRITARLSATYDAVLMPTLADDTPRIGHLDPMASYEQVMERLLDWVAFTPLQNATGDPAISLPLAESAAGMPVGMMLSTVRGQEARLLELAYELEAARPWPLDQRMTSRARRNQRGSEPRVIRVRLNSRRCSPVRLAISRRSADAHTGVGALEQFLALAGQLGGQRAARRHRSRPRHQAALFESPQHHVHRLRRDVRVARQLGVRTIGEAGQYPHADVLREGQSEWLQHGRGHLGPQRVCHPVQQIPERLLLEELTHINYLDIYQPS